LRFRGACRKSGAPRRGNVRGVLDGWGFAMADFAQARRTMVDCQIRPADVTDLRIIAAMQEVPREAYLPASRRALAYLDKDVPVSDTGRSLLKPAIFAKLVQGANIMETDRVLDVGCATGYSSVILSRLSASVVALEEDAALAHTASEMAVQSGASNVSVVSGPLVAGFADGGPYDVIVMEGATEVAPDSLLSQLKDGGRLVAVVGAIPIGKGAIYRKVGGHATMLPMFEGSAALLPGFVKPPAFVF
jgi:protein-L-isoaspartate(D-aspartate) O-methyltransferase